MLELHLIKLLVFAKLILPYLSKAISSFAYKGLWANFLLHHLLSETVCNINTSLG